MEIYSKSNEPSILEDQNFFINRKNDFLHNHNLKLQDIDLKINETNDYFKEKINDLIELRDYSLNNLNNIKKCLINIKNKVEKNSNNNIEILLNDYKSIENLLKIEEDNLLKCSQNSSLFDRIKNNKLNLESHLNQFKKISIFKNKIKQANIFKPSVTNSINNNYFEKYSQKLIPSEKIKKRIENYINKESIEKNKELIEKRLYKFRSLKKDSNKNETLIDKMDSLKKLNFNMRYK